MTVKVTSATGTEGFLIWVGNDCYYRVYQGSSFKDYKLVHSDLQVVIKDRDAELYEYTDGECFLDHSRETLGVKDE